MKKSYRAYILGSSDTPIHLRASEFQIELLHPYRNSLEIREPIFLLCMQFRLEQAFYDRIVRRASPET